MTASRFCIVLALLFSLAACAPGSAVEGGKPAADFSLTDTTGAPVKLTDYQGKIIVLNFFATWCPPCRGEIPDFIDLQRDYADRVQFIGVSNEDAGTVSAFVGRMGITYPVLIDAEGKVFDLYGPIRGVPTTFLIDGSFTVRKSYIGARPRAVFESDIKELLKRT